MIINRKAFLVLLIVFCGSQVFSQSQVIDRKKAWQIIQEQVLNNKFENVEVYVHKDIIKAKEELEKNRKVNSPSFNSYFFFIDEDPYANWAHSCKYCFVNTETGEVVTINSDFPQYSQIHSKRSIHKYQLLVNIGR